MVMDFMDGGDLLDDLYKKGRYTECRVKQITIGILKGINYCHRNNIVHRDLKPENILLNKSGEVKIADFGWSARIQSPYSLTTNCGTFSYTAPEILRRLPYGKSVDIWSIGVIMFIMLGGYHPFDAPEEAQTNDLIVKGKYEFDEKYWNRISFNAKLLVNDFLTLLPTRRPTACDALQSRW
eukprot:CAMPEP_0113306176 /NCGR_PEP_ID=MMETSP0010_2-20120614/5529_1 /TAXON_ID=216773 ORGANISM="Corethron hystrix, Strain 308" /NCGR_SAMPLE_ID=MMETSP0010_2 /ASSEMBLY_ACC=CAM_ASM_000155 /LENGTH=180 /DNA_ID=CAMNT_0000160785 /DNA_START=411 /DNA_END=950 /DNA_ORIENTATION=- /assembly_acc=CAM_ASM_000155